MHALRSVLAGRRNPRDRTLTAEIDDAVIPTKAGIQCKSPGRGVTIDARLGRKHGVGYWIPAFALICMHISAGIGAATRPGPRRPRLKGQRPPALSRLRFRACFGGRRPPSREISASLDRTRVAIGLSILARLTANRPKCQACRPPATLAGRKHARNRPEAFVFSDGAFQAPVARHATGRRVTDSRMCIQIPAFAGMTTAVRTLAMSCDRMSRSRSI